MVEGRNFTITDMTGKAQNAIINETASRVHGIRVGDRLTFNREWEVVGMVKDYHYQSLQRTIDPLFLIPHWGWGWRESHYMYIRVRGENIAATIGDIRATLEDLNPINNAPVEIYFLDEKIGEFYRKESQMTTIVTVSSFLAILISVIGVFGLVLFETQYRRKEIGIRKINGATVSQILRMFNRKFIRLVAVCFVISVPISSFVIYRWTLGFAYKPPVRGWIYLSALLIAMTITAITVTFQSYRAATENPLDSIKTD